MASRDQSKIVHEVKSDKSKTSIDPPEGERERQRQNEREREREERERERGERERRKKLREERTVICKNKSKLYEKRERHTEREGERGLYTSSITLK